MNHILENNITQSTYSRVALLGLLNVAGEDDEARLVRLQALDVDGLALLAQVSPPVVVHDADTTRLLLADARLLELGESEATALADLAVVAHRLRADGGAEELERADAEPRGLGLARVAAAELAAGLVEPGVDTGLPVLAEVVGVKDCRSQDTVQLRSKSDVNITFHEPLLARKPMV